MSSEPNGWQTPKTDWKGGDVPLPSSFRRIEGNAQAIEQGSRTLDPSQAPSGNTGSLRQLLDWFANRIRAITGAANWYNAPATTLASAKSHMDATSGIHGATSSATANRLIIRDAAGRAKFAQGASDGDAVVYPVPVTSLKRAQGSVTESEEDSWFAVHQYAFASPYAVRASGTGGGGISHIGYRGYDAIGGSNGRHWIIATSVPITWTWDYLTASGHPRVWAEVDERGEILSMWEAEDPADPDFPDEPPIQVSRVEDGQPIPGRLVLPLMVPDEQAISVVMQRLQAPPKGEWLIRSRFAGALPVTVHRALLYEQLWERGLEEPEDIRAVYAQISDYNRRNWYLQLWLRQASRLLHDHRSSTLIPLYRAIFRVDRRTGRLVLR